MSTIKSPARPPKRAHKLPARKPRPKKQWLITAQTRRLCDRTKFTETFLIDMPPEQWVDSPVIWRQAFRTIPDSVVTGGVVLLMVVGKTW